MLKQETIRILLQEATLRSHDTFHLTRSLSSHISTHFLLKKYDTTSRKHIQEALEAREAEAQVLRFELEEARKEIATLRYNLLLLSV
jgi:hypothetical protein